MKTKKKGFLDGYKTYDPKVEGYGTPDEWINTFKARIGLEEAQTILGDEDPWKILDINSNESWDVIKKAYRKLMLKFHPDQNPDKKKFAEMMTRKLTAAFALIKNKRGK